MKELKVSAIKEGTVIDHIVPKEVFKVVDILNLEDHKEKISVATNLNSKKRGKKAIIKIEEKFLTREEVDKIALISPEATVNIIKNYDVAEKTKVHLPERFEDVLECPNPDCVTNHEKIGTQFKVVERNPILLRCHYCERLFEKGEVGILR